MTAAKLVVAGARLSCQGPVTYHTVTALHRELLRSIEASQASALELDLSTAEETDSSAIALLVEARLAAERKSIDIHFTGLEQQLLSLAHLYGVDDILNSGPE